MEQQPPTLDEILPLLEAVSRDASGPERALRALHRAWWHTIYFRVPRFEGPWEVLGDLMDALEFYEPDEQWRAESSALFGPEEAVRRVRAALAELGRTAGPQADAEATRGGDVRRA